MKKFKKTIKHKIKKTAESVNLPAVVLRLVVNYIIIYDFCDSDGGNNCTQNTVDN